MCITKITRDPMHVLGTVIKANLDQLLIIDWLFDFVVAVPMALQRACVQELNEKVYLIRGNVISSSNLGLHWFVCWFTHPHDTFIIFPWCKWYYSQCCWRTENAIVYIHCTHAFPSYLDMYLSVTGDDHLGLFDRYTFGKTDQINMLT